ncbi:hypothetical protein Tco_1561959 [Tanacetum coccineum]
MYPEYMPQEDEILPAEEQPLPAAASPTTDSPGYVPESDPEEEPSGDDADDEDEDEDEEEEEEEHPAPADSVPPVHRMTARISIRDEPSISLPPREELLSSDHRTDRPEITLPPRKRLGVDLGPRYEIGEGSSAARPTGGRRADYGFVDPRETVEEVAPMTLEGVNTRVTELTAVQEQDTQDIYAVIGDTQDRQTQIYQSVETLVDDSQYHYETARLLDQEALVSREAWGRSIEVSYMTRSEIMALRSVVMGQQAVISQLQAADRRSQAVTSEMLQADHRRQAEIAALQTFDRTRQEQLVQTLTLMQSLQGQVTTLQGQVTALQGQQGPSGGPAQPVAPEEAGREVWEQNRVLAGFGIGGRKAFTSWVVTERGTRLERVQLAAPPRTDWRIRDALAEPIEAVDEVALITLEGAGRPKINQSVETLVMIVKPLETARSTTISGGTVSRERHGERSYKEMIDQGVTAALAARDATTNGDDSHTSGTGFRRTERVAREMETVFRISNCSVDNHIKFSTCTLLAGALTWWNSHVRIVGQDVAYAMTWTDLRKKMTDKYCPRNEMKKLEVEMFPEESDRVERYVGGLPDMIQGSVVASKPKTMQEATEMASELMDTKINTIAERQAENKRKFENTSRNNQNQQR